MLLLLLLPLLLLLLLLLLCETHRSTVSTSSRSTSLCTKVSEYSQTLERV